MIRTEGLMLLLVGKENWALLCQIADHYLGTESENQLLMA